MASQSKHALSRALKQFHSRPLTGLRLAPITRSTRKLSTTSQLCATWGFIGLGQMGYPMAKNLRAKIPSSDKLVIFDVNKDTTAKFKEEVAIAAFDVSSKGNEVIIAESARAVAAEAETIVTMLPEPRHVRAVYAEFIEPALPPPKGTLMTRLFIDSSTIDVKTSLEVGALIRDREVGEFMDAPVSGGVVGAKAGTLTFMLGGAETLVERATGILSHMGRRILHCGAPGLGLAGKLSNNYLLAISNIATAEAMNLGLKLGLEPKVLAGLINVSTGKCWPSEVNNPVPGVVETAPAGRDYSGGFGVSLMVKDLKLAISAAELTGAKMMLAEVAKQTYEATEQAKSCKGRDFSVVYRYLGGKE